MDKEPEKHPIRDSALENITPEFAKEHKDKSGQTAVEELSNSEDSASSGPSKAGAGVAAMQMAEKAGGMNFTGAGKMAVDIAGKGSGDKKGVLKKGAFASTVVLCLVVILAAGVGVVGNPLLQLGAMDANMRESTGFSGRVAREKEQGFYVVQEVAMEGEMPQYLASDLAKNGVDVGQVTASGDFVSTNKYIANIEELDDLAVVGGGFYANKTEDGQLAFLYDGEVIKAENFVATVDSKPKLYAAVSDAMNLPAKIEYEDNEPNSVNAVYEALGLKRNSFAGWKATGNAETDQKNYEEILAKTLNGNGNGDLTGCRYRYIVKDNATEIDGNWEGEYKCPNEKLNDNGWVNGYLLESPYDASTSITGKSGGELIGDMVYTTYDDENPTERGAQVMSSALATAEPIKSMRAFLALMESLQMTRINENGGPANEIFNVLNKCTTVKYTDVPTNKLVQECRAIINTHNYIAAASQGEYSKTEGQNSSLDRVLNTTNTGVADLVPKTMVNNDKQLDYKPMMEYRLTNITLEPVYDDKGNVVNKRVELHSPQADAGVLSQADNSLTVAIGTYNSETFTSPIGAWGIVNGGLKLNDLISQHVLAGLASDEDTVLAYNHDTNERLALEAAAERATKSPFDISSQYTFMGSIVRGLANASIRSGMASSGSSLIKPMSTMADLASSSTNKLMGSAMADGADSNLLTTFGVGCEQVPTIGSAVHMDCEQTVTLETGYMSKTNKEWKKEMEGKEEEYENFVTRAMNKWTRPGVVDSNICEAYIAENSNWFQKIFYQILDLLNLANSYDACKGRADAIAEANGQNYSFSKKNSKNLEKMRKFAGYTLHDKVYTLLVGGKTKAAQILEKKQKEDPLDNSPAGIISRFTGMSKEDAQLAIDYVYYREALARYDASTRYAFGKPVFVIPMRESALVKHSRKVNGDLYCFWRGRSEYGDVRNRSLVV